MQRLFLKSHILVACAWGEWRGEEERKSMWMNEWVRGSGSDVDTWWWRVCIDSLSLPDILYLRRTQHQGLLRLDDLNIWQSSHNLKGYHWGSRNSDAEEKRRMVVLPMRKYWDISFSLWHSIFAWFSMKVTCLAPTVTHNEGMWRSRDSQKFCQVLK